MKYDANGALLSTEIAGMTPISRGKVRDIYDLGDSLLFIATDRISAFDCVMPNGIPDKGRVLTQMSLFWFEKFTWAPNHLICADASQFPEALKPYEKDLQGRSMIVKKAKTIPLECTVRGYITGSGWSSYKKDGTVCGMKLREGYRQAEKLDKPLFTPSTKAEEGHDINISPEEAAQIVGAEKAKRVEELAIRLYSEAADYAEERGIILADTKFEFGEVAKSIYNFVWDDFASWYLEMTKVALSIGSDAEKINTCAVLNYVLKAVLKLLHPFMPFVTEDIYQSFNDESIMISSWPTVNENFNFDDSNKFGIIFDIITSIRNIRNQKNVAMSKKTNILNK